MMELVLRGLVAVPLIVAGVLKLADPAPTIPALFSGVPAIFELLALLSWSEIAVGMLLISEAPARWGAVPAAGLTFGFAIVSAWRLAGGGAGEDCGCFGSIRAGLSSWHVLGNIALCALAVCLVVRGSRYGRPITPS